MASTTLHHLAREGDVKIMQQALKTNDVNVRDGDGMSPLHFAAWYGHAQCVQAMIAANAQLDAFDHDGATPLHAAGYNGQLSCCMQLVDANADVLFTDNENQSAKDVAIQQQQTDVVSYLRVMEESQRRTKAMESLKVAFAEAEDEVKTYKVEVQKAVKEAKKKVLVQEKEAARIRKETIKLKKERKKSKAGSVIPPGQQQSNKPMSFSQMAMPGHSGMTNKRPDKGTGSRMKDKMRDSPAPAGSPKPQPKITERPLPAKPKVEPGVAADMVLAEFEADGDGSAGLVAFLESLDLKDFARLFDNKMTLEQLQDCSSEELSRLGLPSGARKKIWNTLHPK